MFDLCLICDVSCISSISIEYDNFYNFIMFQIHQVNRNIVPDTNPYCENRYNS